MSDLPEKFGGAADAACPLYMELLAMADDEVMAHGGEVHEAEAIVCSVYTSDLG